MAPGSTSTKVHRQRGRDHVELHVGGRDEGGTEGYAVVAGEDADGLAAIDGADDHPVEQHVGPAPVDDEGLHRHRPLAGQHLALVHPHDVDAGGGEPQLPGGQAIEEGVRRELLRLAIPPRPSGVHPGDERESDHVINGRDEGTALRNGTR